MPGEERPDFKLLQEMRFTPRYQTAMELDEKIARKDEAVAQVMKAVIEELKLEEMIYRTIKRLKLEGEF